MHTELFSLFTGELTDKCSAISQQNPWFLSTECTWLGLILTKVIGKNSSLWLVKELTHTQCYCTLETQLYSWYLPRKLHSPKWFSGGSCIQIKLEFGNVSFWGEGKTRVPWENLSEKSREPTAKWTHIRRQVREPNPPPHWWEASTFTTLPGSNMFVVLKNKLLLIIWKVLCTSDWTHFILCRNCSTHLHNIHKQVL